MSSNDSNDDNSTQYFMENGITNDDLQLLDAKTKRLIQINLYYANYYKALNDILRILAMTFFLMVSVLFCYSFFRILRFPFFLVYSLIGTFGVLTAGTMFLNITYRNNQDFNMLEFPFKKSSAPMLPPTGGSSLPTLYSCANESCCSENQSFDSTVGKCITKKTT